MIVLYIIGYLLLGFILIFILLECMGLYLLKKGPKPFDKKALAKDGGKFVETADGRKVEYFVFGNLSPQAKTVICIHGSGPEAMSEVAFNELACTKLGVKGIAIGLPGYGYTDMKPGRKVIDWPKEDLAAVLKQEAIDTFTIIGHSQGTVHAMAAAYYYPKRCEGFGLNAPLLPSKISKEEGISAAIGSDSLPSTARLQKIYMAWYFAMMHLILVSLAPWLLIKGVIATGPKKGSKTAIFKIMKTSLTRAMIRGGIGGTYETAGDVCYEWGFDPREIKNNNICIWHAADDNACPPEIGKWLCEHYQNKLNIKVNFRADNIGYKHFTYKKEEFLEPEQSMIKALQDGCKMS